ncbi:MAG: radical SAM protein [Candidatus Bathyarchaeota archaeon]|nr:radical SAM protein [Candidatus Bathyarchaeota archaeon]
MAKPQINFEQTAPPQIRVSVGSAIVLGLLEGKLDAEPTTTYLMTYNQGKCVANCGFCPQAKTSQSKAELLSRVSWPTFSTSSVIGKIVNSAKTGKTKRVCIQAINYPQVFGDLCGFIQALKAQVSVPVSVSCQPLNAGNLWLLSRAGTDRIGIAIDAATPQLFGKVKGEEAGGPYSWQDEFTLLRTAIGVFGEGNVSTHIIVGLGETEKEVVKIIQKCVDMGVLPALFAFTPVKGTALAAKSKPKLEAYRRVQLARYLIVNALSRFEDMAFNKAGQTTDFGVGKDLLVNAAESGKPFQTSGCPDCNRPFYNEKPGGPLYNYPRNLNPQETAEIKQQLNGSLT